MSLGTGALQVGRGPEHFEHCTEVSMATLRAGTTPACNCHRHTEKISVERKILTLPYTYLNPRIARAGGQGARIRNDSQKLWLKNKTAARDRSATISCKKPMIRNDQLESDTKRMQATCCRFQGSPRRSRTQMGATAGSIGSILTLPKFHLATFKLITNR